MATLPNDGEWQAALEVYKKQVDDLQAGRKPREIGDEGLTVGHLRDRLLTAKSRALDAGEITVRTYSEYRRTVELLIGTVRRGPSYGEPGRRRLRAVESRLGQALGSGASRKRDSTGAHPFSSTAYDNGLIGKTDRRTRFSTVPRHGFSPAFTLHEHETHTLRLGGHRGSCPAGAGQRLGGPDPSAERPERVNGFETTAVRN